MKIEKETLQKAYKPYDVVTDIDDNVGLIQEVNINTCQSGFDSQIEYSVCWLIRKTNPKCAWFDHEELTSHCNLFFKIAENSCHPMGNNSDWVKKLFKNIV
jgi:hypothetical protein